MSRNLAVIGAGSWGTALAEHLARKGFPVRLWAYEEEVAEAIRARRENTAYLAGCPLSPGIEPTNSLEEACRGAELIVFVVPSHVARTVLAAARPHLSRPLPFISATKGIETQSLLLPSDVILEVLGEEWRPRVGVLSGPSFARDVVRGLPTAVSLAAGSPEVALAAQAIFSSGSLRVYTNPDVTGLQVGGAVKNVIAIAAGISDGLGFGGSARAALITRGLAEMRRLGLARGARAETFSGLSGLGDLVLTCTGDLSRNRTVGVKLGSGLSLGDILRETKMVAEGVHTSEAVVRLAASLGVEMPICQQTHAIVHQGKNPRDAVRELMGRGLRGEVEG